MPEFIARHGLIAVMLIVLIEEAGLPLPVPADLLIVFAGTLAAHSLTRFGLILALLTGLSCVGTTIFFFIAQRGGKPLIDRFGRYLHLGPEELARSQEWLSKRGWFGIALVRAVPVVRHPAVIACALLGVPYHRYILAQTLGSLVYIGVFLGLGATVGPSVIEAIHLPRLAVRLIWLLALAVGLPALLWWLCAKVRSDNWQAVARRRLMLPVLLASIAGTIALSATWAAGATVAGLLGNQRSLDLIALSARLLIGRGVRATTAYVLIYSVVMLVSVLLGTLYAEVLRPQVAPRANVLLRQSGVLALIGFGLVLLGTTPLLALPRANPFAEWLRTGGVLLPLVLVLGIISFAVTTVCGHTLAVAVLGQSEGRGAKDEGLGARG